MKLEEVRTRTRHYYVDEEDNIQGEYIRYYDDAPSVIRSACTYIDDKKEGLYVHFYRNGKVDSVSEYVNNEKDGEYVSWHKNGGVCTRTTFRKGVENGEYMDWHANGQLWEHLFFKDGREHGESIMIKENGEVRSHAIYLEGRETKIPIPTTEEDQFLLCLEHGHMDFLPIGLHDV